MGKEVIICVGISGSGKSTWTASKLKEDKNYLRINRDDIRITIVNNLTGYYQRKDLNALEDIVSNIEEQLFINYDNYYKNIIIDNTNLNVNNLDYWIKKAQKYNYSITIKLFDCSVNKAKSRVALRENYPIGVNKEGLYTCDETDYIDKQYKRYINIKEYILKNYDDYV